MSHYIPHFFRLSSKRSTVHGWFCQIYLLHTVDQIWGECYYKDIESDFWLEISLWKCPFLYFWYTNRNTPFHLCLKEHLMSSYISKIHLHLKYYQLQYMYFFTSSQKTNYMKDVKLNSMVHLYILSAHRYTKGPILQRPAVGNARHSHQLRCPVHFKTFIILIF